MSIGKNAAVGLATDVAVFGLGILVSVVLTRSLYHQDPKLPGIYVLLTTTNFLVASVAHLSVGLACSTLLARGRLRLGEVNTVAVLLAMALGLVSAAVVSVAFPLLTDNVFKDVPLGYLMVALLLIPATIYQVYWNAMMTGLNRIVLMNQLNLGVNIGNALLMIIVLGVLNAGIAGALAVWALGSVAGAAYSALLAARIERFVWPPKRSVAREMLSFGLRGHGANVAQQLFLRFDMFAVNVLIGPVGVTFYSRSTSLAERLWLPINAIYSSSLSKIAQLPRDESALLAAKVARTALLMMLTIAVPFAAISPWLVPFLYGPAFEESVLPLVILAVGTLGFAVMIVLNSFILGQLERPGLLSIISWGELAVSITLYITLILWQGIVGAAIASTLTYMLAMALTLYIFVRYSGLTVGQVLLPRPQDFRDYMQVLMRALRRIGMMRET